MRIGCAVCAELIRSRVSLTASQKQRKVACSAVRSPLAMIGTPGNTGFCVAASLCRFCCLLLFRITSHDILAFSYS